jgi:hypothetical protein
MTKKPSPKNKLKWNLESISIEKLQGFHKNPRLLTNKAYSDLKASLEKFGLIDKPVITHDYTIIGGHQRCKILHDEGETEVECWVPNRKLTDKEVEELNIRLNKNTGEWDFDILANQWETDELYQYGFVEKDFFSAIGADNIDAEDVEGEDFDESITDNLALIVRFKIEIPNEDAAPFQNQLDELLKKFPTAKLEKKI